MNDPVRSERRKGVRIGGLPLPLILFWVIFIGGFFVYGIFFDKTQPATNTSQSPSNTFTCSISTTHEPIISFDNGRSWQWDDGRCTQRLQKQRDQDAEMYSYWSTTVRVDTDMDSFWLNKEERTCQTYPDAKGRVAVVACNPSGSHRDHNIPVKFWGGVDRNTVSDWKCTREGDEFVCRAID